MILEEWQWFLREDGDKHVQLFSSRSVRIENNDRNENGILVEKESPVKLAEAISSLITNEVARKKMGEKAFENIQRFSPEKIYKLWEQLF